MTALDSCPDVSAVLHLPRQRDRRQALPELLAALTRLLDRRSDVALMRGAFEEMLRRVVPVRAVQLREATSRWAGHWWGRAAWNQSPSKARRRSNERGLLEATFDPGCRLGEWDFQMRGCDASAR